MVGEAIAGLGALKTAFDLAKGLKDIDDAARRNAAVIELQERILAGQHAQAELLERISALEKEVANFEQWETEKKNYDLKAVHGDSFAYANKPVAGSTEPPHLICANCYQQRKKRILQRTDMAHLECPDCKNRVRFDSAEAQSFRQRSSYSPRGGTPGSWMGS